MLARTREKLQALEARLGKIEQASTATPRPKSREASRKKARKKPDEGAENSEG
jgi:BMFP domain-containing protein YqiC